ncbi:MAG: carboxypeptidase regulatory-like domain-containing protein [Acidobacteria bacterium]|nr:carboxypeptidase regulatory-like domain-containing protein [Acidobacteriota bacterium]
MTARRAILGVALALTLAAPSHAQTARVAGIVRSTTGQPVPGAIVQADNEDRGPRQVTSTTDAKGRFGMIGLSGGTVWTFVVSAPGFQTLVAPMTVRTGNPGNFAFRLAPTPEPPGGTLPNDIADRITEAGALAEAGRHAEATAAFERLHRDSPTLTMVGMVLGGLYREQARTTTDVEERAALLARAVDAYGDVLEADMGYERARLGLVFVHLDAGDTAAARAALEEAARLNPTSPGVVEAEAALRRAGQ